MDDIAINISDIHVSFGNHHVLRGASGVIKKRQYLHIPWTEWLR